jgi:tetratricopeptide (TPR) repeat protein
VRAAFSRGVALLHDFWYEEAGPEFRRILAADPGCAMAHWGVAMSGFHQIWDRPDAAGMAAGWRELEAALRHPPRSARERAYVAALAGFFRPGPRDFAARIGGYAAAMGRLHAAYPADVDAAAFYALALLAATAPDDTSLAPARRALAILAPLWQFFPDHPGLVHYIIHACDTPALAPEGLAAARHYGAIAASGPHAVHMPGHIFARLGLWQEDIEANAASVAASDAAEARGESGWMDRFHSDDFLLYAYLQRADDAEVAAVAADAVEAIRHYGSMPGMAADHYMTGMFPYYLAKLPVFRALETRDWAAAAALAPVAGGPAETQTQVYWARVIAAGHRRDAAQAHADRAAYDALLAEVRRGRHAYQADSTDARIRALEMDAWVAWADGATALALERMRAAAELQDRVGQDEVDIPAREMLADLLLESGTPGEALAEYRVALAGSPDRLNGLYGAGRAAEAAGERDAALGYFRRLLEVTGDGARTSRAEPAYAKAFVAAAARQGT